MGHGFIRTSSRDDGTGSSTPGSSLGRESGAAPGRGQRACGSAGAAGALRRRRRRAAGAGGGGLSHLATPVDHDTGGPSWTQDGIIEVEATFKEIAKSVIDDITRLILSV